MFFVQACDDKNKEQPTPPTSNDLTIEASISYILADDTQATNFTVKYKGEDVTAKAKIYNAAGPAALTAPSFKTKEVGSYQFYAEYNTESSKKISVAAANMPIDANPDKFNFKKRVLLTELTGTWCQYCPYAIKALHDFEAKPNADDAVIIAAHNSDALESAKAKQINRHLSPDAYPSIMAEISANRTRFPEIMPLESLISNSVDSLKVFGAKTGIAVSSKVVNGKICVRTQIKISADGNYGIGVLLLEDNVFAKQKNDTEFKEDYFDYHRHVIRAGAPNAALYDPLGTAGATTVGKHIYYTEFSVDNTIKTENCRVAVFVYNVTEESSDNAVQVAVGTDFPYSYR